MLVSEPSCSDGAEQQSSGLNRRGFRLRLRRPVGCVVMAGGLILLAQLAGRLSRVCLVANLSICAVAVGNLEALAQAAGAFGEERRLTRSIPSSELLRQTDNSATQRLRLDVGDRVFFAPGSAALGLRARAALARQAEWLSAARRDVFIVGHADDGGSERNNQRIASRRAEVVCKRLIEEGVPAGRLHYFGKGRQDRIAICDGSLCQAQNRRVVTIVLRER